MRVLTARRAYQIREYRRNEYSVRYSIINSCAGKAGTFGSGAHSLQIVSAAYDYAHRVFDDLLEVERSALRKRLFFLRRRAYFNKLTSSMRTQFQVDFWEAVNEQFKSISSACEVGRYKNPLKTAIIQQELEKLTVQINVMVWVSVDATREEFEQSIIKAIWTTILKLIASLRGVIGKSFGQ
jgi:hypothetical protein